MVALAATGRSVAEWKCPRRNVLDSSPFNWPLGLGDYCIDWVQLVKPIRIQRKEEKIAVVSFCARQKVAPVNQVTRVSLSPLESESNVLD